MQKTVPRDRDAVVALNLVKPPQLFRLTTKTLLIMKLTIVLLALGLFSAQAGGFSQTITYAGKNVPLPTLFSVVEKQTGYSVFANKGLLKDVKRVTITARDMPLTEFLNAVFKGQPVDYEINNKTIFIKERPGMAPVIKTPVAEPEKVLPDITGSVKGAEGEPLAGATITIRGSSQSTVTGVDGRFSIKADKGQTLVITYVGYQQAEVRIGDNNVVTITLQKAEDQIEQVVVTALGITKKTKALTYNVQEIKGEEVNRIKDANFMNSLAGKVAGVTINTASSGIGGSARVVSRGAKSLFRNNNALYVIDGMPLPDLITDQANDVFSGAGATGDGISNINPEDIASISVLTGPAAAALYGYQAANGVVIITTKKGSVGKTSLNLTNSTNFFSPFVLPRFQNTYGSEPEDFYSWGPKLKTPGTYDPKDFFQTGSNVTNGINLSTGNEKNQTYFSASSVNAKGIIPNNELNRYNFSIRNTSNLLNDRFHLDLGAMYVKADEQNMISQGQYFNPLIPVYLFPRGDDIEKYKVFERYNATRNFKTQFWPFGDMGFQMQNPYWITQRDFFNTKKDRYVLNVAAKYDVADWVNITGRVKLDNNTAVGEKKYYASTSGLFASPAGAYHKATAVTQQIYADVLVNVNRTFQRKYSVAANVGASILDAQYNLEGYGGNLLSVPNLFSYSNINADQAAPRQERYHDQVQSVFGTVQLGYRNMIFVDLTGRSDWASSLAYTTDRTIFYPSVGVAGILSDLIGLHSNVVNYIKVRGAYSEVGNPPLRFVSYATSSIVGSFPRTATYMPASTLQPERTKSFEAGINLRLLNKINLDVTAYKSSTYNQLFNPNLAPSTGYTSLFINAGQVDNKGIEASLSFKDRIIGNLNWSGTVTFSLNRNKIVQLLPSYIDHTTGQFINIDSLSMGGTGSYITALTTGGSIGDIYVTTLATDEHGYIFVNSATQTVTADPNTYVKAGSANPRYNIGFRNSFSYKNFTLDFLVNARVGGVCVSVTQAIMDRFGVSEASAKARDEGGVLVNGYKLPAQPYYEVVGGGVAGVGSMYTYSATNVRLAEASLGYTFPARFFPPGIQGVTLAVTGRNLFMFYNKAPFDPEATANTGTYYQGVDYFMQPSLRSVGFSAKIQF